MVGYVCYAASPAPWRGSHLDYLGELGIRYLHLMPLLAPREGDSDGGRCATTAPSTPGWGPWTT